MAIQLGITADGVKCHLTKLKNNANIEHKGSRKSGYWVVIKDIK